MKRLKPEDLPSVLTEDVIQLLVEMAMEFPKTTFDWANISELLVQRGQLTLILDKVEEVKKRKERERLASMTDEEKAIEEAKWKKIREDTDPFKFYGNMGQPETPEEFKDRYGVWPPGYNENGNKLTDSDEKN